MRLRRWRECGRWRNTHPGNKGYAARASADESYLTHQLNAAVNSASASALFLRLAEIEARLAMLLDLRLVGIAELRGLQGIADLFCQVLAGNGIFGEGGARRD